MARKSKAELARQAEARRLEGVPDSVRPLMEADADAVYDPVDKYPERPYDEALSDEERKRLEEERKAAERGRR